jgi:CubicO group peptidase (beta-lactamase class C family)
MSTELRYGSPQEAGMDAGRVDHIKGLGWAWVEEGVHPALVVLAARNGVIFLHEAYGRLRPDEDTALPKDAIFPVSSLSKPLVAACVMLLTEEGVLGPNRPVRDYIPELTGEGKDAILVHHLLTHTSGFAEEDVQAHSYAAKKSGAITIPPCPPTQHPRIHELLYLQYGAPLSKAPGEAMSYSNHNYLLLGEIVRRASGVPLADFARTRIFEPLGMHDTSFIVPEGVRPRVVKRPESAPGGQRMGWVPSYNSREHEELPHAFGGAYSTAFDMAVFCQMFLNLGSYGSRRLLSPPTVTKMTRNQIPGIGATFGDEYHSEGSWGYGWSVQGPGKWAAYSGTLSSPSTFDHSGSGGIRVCAGPENNTLTIYFSVELEFSPSRPLRNGQQADLFINAVLGSIDE